MKSASRSGFTLLEILVAMAIFTFGVLVLIQSRNLSLRSTFESEDMFKATQLAQTKMAEMEMKFQSIINREGVKDGLKMEEAGKFDPPFDTYTWKAELTDSTVKLSADQIRQLLEGFGIEKEDIEAQLEQQKLLLANINKMIRENYAELKVTIEWQRFNRPYRMPIVTHLIPNEPKIQLTTNPDEGESSSPESGG